jgi:hypothetical protein
MKVEKLTDGCEASPFVEARKKVDIRHVTSPFVLTEE